VVAGAEWWIVADTPGWTPLTAVNSTLAFLLELLMLAALAFWGAHTGSGVVVKILLAVGAPVAAAVVWWLLLAARGPRIEVPRPVRAVLKVVLFGLTGLALAAAGWPVVGVVFGTVALLNVIVEYAIG
jgi:hypothetical protein